MRVTASERARHLFLRAHEGELLPDALLDALRLHEARAGWGSGHGVLADVEVRTIDPRVGEPSVVRRIEGPVRAAVIDMAVGESAGEISLGLRAMLSWEGPQGMVVVAGEIVKARVIGLEAHVVALEDAPIERALDRASGVWLWAVDVSGEKPPPRPKAPAEWGEAIAASEDRGPVKAKPVVTGNAPIPARPTPPKQPEEEDAPFPEPGDMVEHFAFGRGEVLKSDGDRLHVKLDKDGRIREIALEMLKVSPLESSASGRKRFKLDRKL